MTTTKMVPPKPPFPEPTGVYSTHKANCHCGAVRFSFSISPPLESYPVVNCNCSICQRSGYLLVYPSKKNFTLEAGGGGDDGENGGALGSYTFANHRVKHSFCKKCGSSVFFEITTLHPDLVEQGHEAPDIMGMNVSPAYVKHALAHRLCHL